MTPSRTARPGTYFVTFRTYNSRRIFQVPATYDLFLEILQHYRAEGNYLLHAFVVMPDHIHLLLTHQMITLECAMGLIKGGFSHRLASKLPVWQRSYTDHRIRDRADFETHRHYIHQNPARAHLPEPTPGPPLCLRRKRKLQSANLEKRLTFAWYELLRNLFIARKARLADIHSRATKPGRAASISPQRGRVTRLPSTLGSCTSHELTLYHLKSVPVGAASARPTHSAWRQRLVQIFLLLPALSP